MDETRKVVIVYGIFEGPTYDKLLACYPAAASIALSGDYMVREMTAEFTPAQGFVCGQSQKGRSK